MRSRDLLTVRFQTCVDASFRKDAAQAKILNKDRNGLQQ